MKDIAYLAATAALAVGVRPAVALLVANLSGAFSLQPGATFTILCLGLPALFAAIRRVDDRLRRRGDRPEAAQEKAAWRSDREAA